MASRCRLPAPLRARARSRSLSGPPDAAIAGMLGARPGARSVGWRAGRGAFGMTRPFLLERGEA